MKSYDVKFWDVRRNKSSKAASYVVRWTVAGKQRSKTFRTKALAENFLSDLRQAARQGEHFDVDSGLPDSMIKVKQSRTWLHFALAYVDMKWPHAAAKTRDSLTDALSTVTVSLVDGHPGKPDDRVLRRALRQYAMVPASRELERPPEIAQALAWLERASLSLSELEKPRHVRTALEAVALCLDGSAAASTTIHRKRSVFHNVLEYAVELEELSANPLARVKWKPPKVAEIVDSRVVVNPRQANELLNAVTYVGRVKRGRHLRGFFACLYYAGLRPGEALALRAEDCYLPDKGWGRLTLTDSRPIANKRWTNSGEVYDDRSLKHRAEGETRPIPIPPDLVTILSDHLSEFGAGTDGRLFRTSTGGYIYEYAAIWASARALALTPEQVGSPLAARPYDLRHAAVSLWLNAGVPVTEVAERAGHGVDVLLRVYAKCIDGGEGIANERIQAVLAS